MSGSYILAKKHAEITFVILWKRMLKRELQESFLWILNRKNGS